ATVIQLDPIKLVGFLPETEIAKVEPGAQAGARLATGAQVTGAVTFIGRSADPATRTFRVEVQLPNPDMAIRDGQTVEMVLASGNLSAHLVPQSALTLNDAGDIGVRIVGENAQALFVPVTVLRDSVQGVWLAGLPERADIISIGQEYVTDGVPVQASYDGAAQ
ncbi:HlyD family efflux transporter periplasmic adaptor subunit, partial [Escherichia coli]|nr:HlyD family efflux transporter periplasmic adaptor subunit [Escherichia coli]